MLKAGAIKSLFELITFEESLDGNGQKIRRTSFPKKHFKSFQSLRKLLIKDVEVGIEFENKIIVWKKLSEVKPEDKMISEKFVDSEIELSDSEKEAAKFVVSSLEELPLMDEEEYSDFVKLIGFDPAA